MMNKSKIPCRLEAVNEKEAGTLITRKFIYIYIYHATPIWISQDKFGILMKKREGAPPE